MVWYEKHNFSEDPFQATGPLLGLEEEQEELLYRVAAGSLVLIEGPEGSGKSALLRHIINNFKGKGKVAYVDGSKLNKALDIEKVLAGGRKPKGMILLLDNVSGLSRKNTEKIKYHFDQDNILSVVFTTDSYKDVDFDDSLRDRLRGRVVTLKSLTQKNVVGLLKLRLGKSKALTNKVLDQIAKHSSDAADALRKATQVGEYIDEKGDIEDIDKIVKTVEQEKDDSIYACPTCGEKLKQIGSNWRCKSCDDFCSGCGASVEDEDKNCPECGVKFG